MSKYIKTLDRLKTESWADSTIREYDAGAPSTPVRQDPSSQARRHLTILEPQLQDAHSIESLSHLSEGIRALTHSSAAPGAVVAGISSSGPIDVILDRVVDLAAQSGIRLSIAEFEVSRGSRLLRMRDNLAVSNRTGHGLTAESPTQLNFPKMSDLDLSSGWEEAEQWIANAARSCDLVLIKAPPILELVDGALLAKIAGGLVLVVELLRTSRADLSAAVHRARTSECPILGVVAAGPESRVPKWLAGLMSPSANK